MKKVLIVFAMDDKASEYISQKLLEQKKEIDKSTIVIGDFKTPFTNLKNKQAKKSGFSTHRKPQKYQ